MTKTKIETSKSQPELLDELFFGQEQENDLIMYGVTFHKDGKRVPPENIYTEEYMNGKSK